MSSRSYAPMNSSAGSRESVLHATVHSRAELRSSSRLARERLSRRHSCDVSGSARAHADSLGAGMGAASGVRTKS